MRSHWNSASNLPMGDWHGLRLEERVDWQLAYFRVVEYPTGVIYFRGQCPREEWHSMPREEKNKASASILKRIAAQLQTAGRLLGKVAVADLEQYPAICELLTSNGRVGRQAEGAVQDHHSMAGRNLEGGDHRAIATSLCMGLCCTAERATARTGAKAPRGRSERLAALDGPVRQQGPQGQMT